MQKLGTILQKFNLDDTDKFLSREFQKYGLYLAQNLGDMKHKSLYIKLAKDIPRHILEDALTFVLDSRARNMGALFMWKVKELKAKLPIENSKKVN
jgi:hypothetical protein